MQNRNVSKECLDYLLLCKERDENNKESNITNDFDKGMELKKKLLILVPDLYNILDVKEIDAIIDLIYYEAINDC